MRVLITGSNGLLGQNLVKIFSSNYQIVGIDLKTEPLITAPNFIYRNISILEQEKLKELFASFNPEVVINAGAYTDVDKCEQNEKEAWSVNVEGVKILVRLCRETRAKLIHLSTDFIFNGKDGPYSEEATPHPINYYGITKLVSENVISNNVIDFLIVRTNVLYGKSLGKAHNFVLTVIDKLLNKEEYKAAEDLYNNPTLADNLAEAIKEAVEQNILGILNIAGGEYLSRYDFVMKVAKKFELDQNLILSIKTSELPLLAPRPLKGGLKIDKAKKLLETELLGVEKGLEYIK